MFEFEVDDELLIRLLIRKEGVTKTLIYRRPGG